MESFRAVIQHHAGGGIGAAAMLRFDLGQALSQRFQARFGQAAELPKALQLQHRGLAGPKPLAVIHYFQWQAVGMVQHGLVVAPPEQFSALGCHTSGIAVALAERLHHLCGVAHRQDEPQGNLQFSCQSPPEGQ